MVKKGGRPPKGDYPNRLATFSTRVTPELREALDEAARRGGRSLSQEVERRLRRSFDADSLEQAFENSEHYALARIFKKIIDAIEHISFRPWHDSAYTVDAVGRAMWLVLKAFQGSTSQKAPESTATLAKNADALAYSVAGGILDSLTFPSPPPLDKKGVYHSKQMHMFPRIREGLGDLIDRLPPPDRSSDFDPDVPRRLK